MIRDFLTLVRVEWIKTMRMKSTYIAFAAAGVLVMMVQIGMYFGAEEWDLYRELTKQNLSVSLLLNSFISTRIGMEVGLLLLIAPMVIQTFARQIAGEDLKGTLRLILSRPISRLALLNAKFVVCGLYCLLLMSFFLGMSYSVGLIFYGPQKSITIGHPRELDPDLFKEEITREREALAKRAEEIDKSDLPEPEKKVRREVLRREERSKLREARTRVVFENYVITNEQAIQRLLISIFLSSWALMTVGALAFFYSVINRHPIAAMAATIGTYFLVLILQELSAEQNVFPLFKKMQPYLFTHAMDYWLGCFSSAIDWTRIQKDAVLLGVYTAVIYGITNLIFWRKDITS